MSELDPKALAAACTALGDAWDCPEEDDDRIRVYASAAIRAYLAALAIAQAPAPGTGLDDGVPIPESAQFWRENYLANRPAPAPEPSGAMLSSARTIVAEEINMPPDSAADAGALQIALRALKDARFGLSMAAKHDPACDMPTIRKQVDDAIAAIRALKEPHP